MVFGFVMYEPITYESYVYPWWANVLGWGIALSSILCMPGMAIIQILRTEGTLIEVSIGFCMQKILTLTGIKDKYLCCATKRTNVVDDLIEYGLLGSENCQRIIR